MRFGLSGKPARQARPPHVAGVHCVTSLGNDYVAWPLWEASETSLSCTGSRSTVGNKYVVWPVWEGSGTSSSSTGSRSTVHDDTQWTWSALSSNTVLWGGQGTTSNRLIILCDPSIQQVLLGHRLAPIVNELTNQIQVPDELEVAHGNWLGGLVMDHSRMGCLCLIGILSDGVLRLELGSLQY